YIKLVKFFRCNQNLTDSGPNMYLNCPVDNCGEQFTSFSKSLGNRLVRSLMSEIGILDNYELALTVYVREYARQL
uniref:hypothetical protein n=1 Tax=Endozoicomonas sp. ONNA2 TaxID=2828741 RepID=UPI002148218B